MNLGGELITSWYPSMNLGNEVTDKESHLKCLDIHFNFNICLRFRQLFYFDLTKFYENLSNFNLRFLQIQFLVQHASAGEKVVLMNLSDELIDSEALFNEVLATTNSRYSAPKVRRRKGVNTQSTVPPILSPLESRRWQIHR